MPSCWFIWPLYDVERANYYYADCWIMSEPNCETSMSVPDVRLLRLNAPINGMTTGILAALGLFVATNWLVIKGGVVVGPNLGLLSQFFPGYTVTRSGSFIGAAYGFGLGFCVGFVVSLLYNSFVGRKSPASDSQ